jgi:hypothetical protein
MKRGVDISSPILDGSWTRPWGRGKRKVCRAVRRIERQLAHHHHPFPVFLSRAGRDYPGARRVSPAAVDRGWVSGNVGAGRVRGSVCLPQEGREREQGWAGLGDGAEDQMNGRRAKEEL